MDIQSLLYTSTHEWVHLDGEIATVGISKFAVDQLTDLIVIDLPSAGGTLVKGKPFGEVESVKAVSDLYAPVSGTIVEVNKALKDDVQILAEDPYEKGWLLKVKVDPSTLPGDLLGHDAYSKKVAEEAH